MLRVLLVDDEPFIVQGLAVLVDWESEGYKIVATASNGEEAITYLRENKVDLIIADIRMPVMTGIEFMKHIQAEKISSAYFVILSGYSDFQYVQMALRYACVDYILKPIRQEDILVVLRKVSELCKFSNRKKKENKQKEKAFLTRNVISLLSGKYDQMNLDYVKKYLRLTSGIRYIYIEIDDMNQDEYRSEEEKRKLQRKLYQCCMECFGETYENYCFFDVSYYDRGYDMGIIYGKEMAEKSQMDEQQYLFWFHQEIQKHMEVPVIMFVGSPVNDISQIEKSYQTAAIVRSIRAFKKNETVHFYEEWTEKHTVSEILYKNVLDELIREIEANNKAGIDQKTQKLYEKMNEPRMNVQMVRLNINYLLFQLIHLASSLDSNLDQEEIMHRISSDILGGRIVNDNDNSLKHFAYEYADYLVQLRKDISSGILIKIEREIKEKYMENLTLKELSKKYYINSAYLGQIFKKKYGMSFRDYLREYRMEQAAMLLLRTNKRIYEIADEVGYKNLDYFINRFITCKGCTPAKFRKQSRETSHDI